MLSARKIATAAISSGIFRLTFGDFFTKNFVIMTYDLLSSNIIQKLLIKWLFIYLPREFLSFFSNHVTPENAEQFFHLLMH